MATIIFNKELHSDAIAAVRKFKNIKAQIDALEKELEEQKSIILAAMGQNDTAITKVNGISFTVTNKVINSTRVDTKELKFKYPDIAKECSSTSSSLRFIIK